MMRRASRRGRSGIEEVLKIATIHARSLAAQNSIRPTNNNSTRREYLQPLILTPRFWNEISTHAHACVYIRCLFYRQSSSVPLVCLSATTKAMSASSFVRGMLSRSHISPNIPSQPLLILFRSRPKSISQTTTNHIH